MAVAVTSPNLSCRASLSDAAPALAAAPSLRRVADMVLLQQSITCGPCCSPCYADDTHYVVTFCEECGADRVFSPPPSQEERWHRRRDGFDRCGACADLAIAWAVKVEHAAIVAIAATAGDTMAVAGAVAPVGGKTSLRPEKTGHFQSLAISTNNTRGMLEILQPTHA